MHALQDDHPPLQRIGPLAKAAQLLGEHGFDIADALDGLGVTIEDLGSPDNYIPFQQAIRLLDRCAEISSIPHFGLLLGSTSGLAEIGMAGQLMAAAPTLRDALIAFVGVQPGYSSGASFYITSLGDEWILGYNAYVPQATSSHQIYDLVMAVACNVIEELTSSSVRPLEVLVCHTLPENRRPYDAFFRVPLRFNQRQAGLVFHRRALDTPIPTASAERTQFMLLKLRLARPDIGTFAAKVRHILTPMLLVNHGRMDEVAQLLSLSPITVRRRLADEGTNFSTLRDEVREGVALELLCLTDMPVHDVAAAVAFEHHSTFTRAVRRWTGKSPAEIRKKRA